uniref:Sugar transferase n=1 Tax=Chlorobium chlorochromatii (strain CaD3) TaxID=340177 RepID=Q3AST3_CHLCH
MMLAPVALFVYARPDHTRKTVEALQKNELAKETDLIIFSDAARIPDKESVVNEVRAYLATISGFRSVTIHHRPYNFGLAKSIIEGVTQVLSEHERIIVLEDDMVTSPYFFSYMNDALKLFANDDRVISIHGYVYPVKQQLPEAFFLRGADCWGWATWRRGWVLFNRDGQVLLDELKQCKLTREFDFNGSYPYTKMLEAQIKGQNDSWAIRWYASAFLANKLTLYPGRSLVHNIGNDSSGTHCGNDTTHDVDLSSMPINITNIDVLPSIEVRQVFESFFAKSKGSFLNKLHISFKKAFV